VISVIALFVALGGTSYAITQLPKNSVGTPQLKKNAVTAAKVKDGSLTGADINVATLGTVPSASSASSANTAQIAGRAETAGSAQTADSAGTARTAERATTADSATTASSATTAGFATSASSASTAGSASTAANATALNGMSAAELILASKLHCPTGMGFAAGACVDDQPRTAASLRAAFEVCAEENFRLPTAGELIAYVHQYVDGTVTEWVEPEVVTGDGFQGVLLTASKVEYSPSTFDPSAPRPYRCVTAATN
jgi:hypothetical protein